MSALPASPAARRAPLVAPPVASAATLNADAASAGSAPGAAGEQARRLARIDRMARLLDARFRLPGTPFRFGWDSILGLVPGLGDLVTFGPAVWMIAEGVRGGARPHVLARMAVNSGLDLLIGAVPVLGDLFDAAFKANLRNAELLRQEFSRPR